ncbi:hypothetical protein NQZ79_g7744 [Umbelopsis isabellina]|nr:hypothetical protein NQZ79_g7744 [Umbelopsis isabellina]
MKNFESYVKTTINALEHMGLSDRHANPTGFAQPNQSTMSYTPAYSQWNNQAPDLFPQAEYPRVVHPSKQTGKLEYPPYNENGDHLFDFSYAGFNEGWTPVPNAEQIATVVTLSPGEGRTDDADRIQDAINQISKMPANQSGFRGALTLDRGVFHISHPIEITHSGIVIRGAPTGGTTLEATSAINPLKSEYLIRVAGQANEFAKKRVAIVDEYVPVGSIRVKVADHKRFKVGDQVVVGANFNQQWIKAIGMDVIHPKGDTTKNNGWKPGRFDHFRRVMHVDQKTGDLYLNVPLTQAIAKWAGGGHVEAYTSKRVALVGFENLEFTYPTNRGRGKDQILRDDPKTKDYRFAPEMFANYVFKMDDAENCWVKNVRSSWFRNFAQLGNNTLCISIEGCQHTYPLAKPDKNPTLVGQFAFEISGQLILIDRCHVELSFHAYSYKGRVCGPNVVHQCTAVGRSGDIGPHMKWSSGQLYDSCNFEGTLIIQDRFDAGSGHGWSGANSVVWNTVSHSGMIVQQPPTAQNFVIGSSEKKGRPRMPQHPWAWTESEGKKVNPPSLYLAQLHERRGTARPQ